MPEVEPDAVGVARAGAGAGADDHLVAAEVRDDLVDEREHRGAAAVDDALAADLDDVGVGKNLDNGLGSGFAEQRFVGQGAVHQRTAQRGQEFVPFFGCTGVGLPPAMPLSTRQAHTKPEKHIHLSLKMARSTNWANSSAVGAGRSSLPSSVCTRAASVMLETSQTPCAASRSAGRSAR